MALLSDLSMYLESILYFELLLGCFYNIIRYLFIRYLYEIKNPISQIHLYFCLLCALSLFGK